MGLDISCWPHTKRQDVAPALEAAAAQTAPQWVAPTLHEDQDQTRSMRSGTSSDEPCLGTVTD